MPRRHVLIILVLMIATLSMVNAAQKDRFYDQNRRFSRILSLIMNSYYKEVDADVLFEGAYQGMLSELDPYCQYFSEKEYKSFTEDTSGKFGGLGIEIGLRDGILTVITPIAGTPAYEAGVMPGDKILKIDGESTERISLQEALNILRGEPGSSVTISVRHRDSDINKDITIVRAVIKPAIIEFNLAAEEPKIGIIKVYSFTSEMIKQFDDAADALKRDKIQGIILDLRGNPGGLLEGAIDLSNRFLSEGVIVSVRGRGSNEYTWKASAAETKFEKLPTVVLVNGGTASASEITAAALQGNKRALVVGTATYGKGAVQSVTELDDKSALKLTTAMYYTPGNKPISREHPVEPDVHVDMTVDQMIALRQQRMEDKLRGEEYTPPEGQEQPDDKEPAKVQPKEEPKEEPKDDKAEDGEEAKGNDKRKRASDLQIDSALAILRVQIAAAGK